MDLRSGISFPYRRNGIDYVKNVARCSVSRLRYNVDAYREGSGFCARLNYVLHRRQQYIASMCTTSRCNIQITSATSGSSSLIDERNSLSVSRVLSACLPLGVSTSIYMTACNNTNIIPSALSHNVRSAFLYICNLSLARVDLYTSHMW